MDESVQYNTNSSREELYVVPSSHSALLGRVWIRHLQINLKDIGNRASTKDQFKEIEINSISYLMQKKVVFPVTKLELIANYNLLIILSKAIAVPH